MTAVAPPGAGTVDITLRYQGSMGGSPASPGDQFTYSGSKGVSVFGGGLAVVLSLGGPSADAKPRKCKKHKIRKHGKCVRKRHKHKGKHKN